ncbi:pre-mRNA-splicing factor CWC25 homolog [Selaginella moellendorffii]|uniref:pre-mRNA-splicing factor CWC25 homolog n=1 Tax=Selaginella moellendorffii TaxID=88036 RepID=UPI000D1D0B5E|nr:pre-mRNA-splicing factor CWC25 homolog [Selaginella moellendorffii]|eukprot:XP_024534967.1 pre-mRNA-splicing factor CWC25 homolog [Selaginella moellendorffii]
MALKFLNKKGWHTGSLRNIETVWKAEQKRDVENRKLEELQKQIKEEQEHLEFRKLQEQAGLVPKQERLDFLYESGLGVGKPSNEEYLLGKPLEESKGESVIQQVAATPGSLFVEEKISANDQWRKIRSDPLLLIKQQELAARERIKNNPLKMEALRKEVETKIKAKEEKKEEKKRLKAQIKAEEKQKRKALKKMMKNNDGREPETEMVDGEDSRSHARENGEDRHRSSRASEDDDRYSRRKRSARDDDDEDRHRSKRIASSQDDRRDPSSSESGRQVPRRAFERDEQERYRSKPSTENDDTRSRRERHDSPDMDDRQRRHEDRHRESRAFGKPPLPRKKVELSEEEKMARLREMQQDAELHEEQRWQRIKKASASDAIQAEKDSIKSSRNFLDEANRSVYGAEGGGNSSVADTLHRRSHYREKFTDKNAFRRS